MSNSGVPVPDLMLRRVYLRHVGPAAARFDPLDLDMTGPSGNAASKVLLSLTNTGGKTTLLRLLTSVVVPNARAQMGGANIGDYVQTGDTSHVVAEWQSKRAGRFVVAGCYEWPGRNRPRDVATGTLNRAFYTFRVPSGFDIADLPFVSDGRRRTMDDYRVALHDVFRNNSSARFVWTRTQSEWTTVLNEHTDLDPQLFRYQMRMNDDEGDAQRLVSQLHSPDAVVEFFVSALNDREVTSDFTTTLAKYATAAAKRAILEHDSEFSVAMAERLERVADAAEYATLADGEVTTRASAAGELAAQIVARAELEERARETALGLQRDHDARATEANTETNRLDNIRSQLMFDEAQFRLATATVAEHEARTARDTAAHEHAIAKLLEPLARLRAAQAELSAARRAYELAESNLTPLRDALRSTGAGLAAKYDSLIAAATAEAKRNAEVAERAGEQRDEAGRARTEAIEARASARRELEDIERLRVEALDALETLRSTNDVLAGETSAAARARWQQTAATAETERRAAEHGIDALGVSLVALEPNQRYNAKQLRDAETTLQRVVDEHDQYGADLAAVLRYDELAAILGTGDPDLESLHRGHDLLAEQAQAAEQAAADADAALRDRKRELNVLEADDLLATSPDVARVRDHLVEHGVGATTGWAWIAANIADVTDRRNLIARNPEIANGVVVTDSTRLDEAREVLGDVDLDLRIAVLVTPPPGLYRTDASAGFVVEPHRAVYDPEWAARAADELRAEITSLSEAAASARATGQRLRATTADVAAFLRRWTDRQPTMDARLDAARVAVDDYGHRVESIRAQQKALEGEREELRLSLPELHRTIRAAELAEQRCAVCERAEVESAAANDRRPGVTRRHALAEQAVQTASATIDRLEDERDAALKAEATASSTIGRWRDRLGGVGFQPGDTVPEAPVEQLEKQLTAQRETLTEKEAGSTHARVLDAVEAKVADLSADVGRHDRALIPPAEELLNNLLAATSEGRADLLAKSQQSEQRQIAAHLRAEHEVDRARETVTERQPSGRRAVHIQLPEEWMASDAAGCVELAGRAEKASQEWSGRLRDAQSAATAARSAADTADRAAVLFAGIAGNWAGDPVVTGAVFHGTTEEAQAGLRHRIDAHRAALDERDDAFRARSERRDAVKQCAVESKFSEFALARKALSTSDDELFGRAREWSRDLRIRAANIHDELVALNRHRDSLVAQLHALAESQLRLLRAVTRSSTIPPGFGEISGQPAFKIDFERLDETEAKAKLASRVDAWAVQLAADPKRGSRADQIDRWLAEAAKDLVKVGATGSAWRVKVLKPLVDNRIYYCSPDRIEREYSGGQELTLAVLMYCCLAAVRSMHRSTGPRPPGALLLDNPFGRASNPQLIAMQQALAGKSGIQLICATGLDEPNILAAFEGSDARILRLRNDINQRGGLRHLRITDELAAKAVTESVLAGHEPDDPNGYVTALGYSVVDRPERLDDA